VREQHDALDVGGREWFEVFRTKCLGTDKVRKSKLNLGVVAATHIYSCRSRLIA
jgi:hypothetical protein